MVPIASLKMKKLEINNFRCFENLVVDLKNGINLLVGDNGSGKTSLLQACKYVLSAYFSGFSDENTKWLAPKRDDFRDVVVDAETLVDEMPIQIIFEQENLFEGAAGRFSIQKNSWKNSRPLQSGIEGYKLAAKQLKESYYKKYEHGVTIITKPLPLFASFTTEDIHAVRKIAEKKFLSLQTKPSFGYYECLECNGLLKYWMKRLLVLAEAEHNGVEYEVVRKAVIDALGEGGCGIISDMFVRPIRKKIYYRYVDGREAELDHLSDGYKRLVNIVTDLAFRCVLLNKSLYGIESAKKTNGTVLIDEIDMHLHPRLQSLVLHGLKRAFPCLQFIIATHAPMVMTGVINDMDNIVYKLDYKDNRYTIEKVSAYGMGASEILKMILEVNPRDAQVDRRLQELFDDIDNGRDDSANRALMLLTSEFHESLPELAQARTMLEFNKLTNDKD